MTSSTPQDLSSGTVVDPVCGMTVRPAKAAGSSELSGDTYFFCSAGCKRKFDADPEHYRTGPSAPSTTTQTPTLDPVCGMKVDPSTARSAEAQGTTYFFCGESCVTKFRADPGKYLHPRATPPTAATPPSPAGTEYVCPMDPEVSQIGPGVCPKCGMALEPATLAPATHTQYTCPMHPDVLRDQPGSCPFCGMALEPTTVEIAEANPELEDMRRRLLIGGALTLPLLLVMLSDLLPSHPLERLLSPGAMGWFELALASPVVLWAGWPFFVRGGASVRNRHLNMFTLIALGSGAAYLYSLIAVIAPGLFPPAFRDSSGHLGLYFEAAAVITVLVLLGQVLELRARSQTSGAIKALLGLAPRTAKRLSADGSEADVPLADIHIGDTLRIRPGDKVPIDGVLTEGTSSIDESMVTGEPIPVEKQAGDKVTSGTINGTGSFLMKVERVGSETLLAQIVQMVSQAQRTRAPIQRLADVVAGYFVPAVLLCAATTFAIWARFGPQPHYAHALVNAVAVLIIACPCALGLATPMAIMVGTGRGAAEGILISNAEALETFEKVTLLVIDKTGTLTEGRPRLTALVAVNGVSEDQLLRAAASLEKASEHPLAGAVLAAASARGVDLQPVTGFNSVTGKGILGTIDRREIAVGNAAMMADRLIALDAVQGQAEILGADGQTVIFVAFGTTIAGLLAVADPVKATTAEAIQALRREGLEILMLTGDSERTARAVADPLGIRFQAGVLPDGKAAVIRQLQESGAIVAMAGDGVNDAPALAQAQVGIAMGTGTDVAMKTGGITLVKGDLRGIVKARHLSVRTMNNIRQNLFFAFFYNALGVPLAAGILYPAFGLLLSPVVAAAAMSFSSVSVITNALRLRSARL